MKKLFETTKINQMELKNRFVRSATWEGLANPDGSCSDELTDLMVDLAKGQVGLIISSHAYVNPAGQAGIRQLSIDNDRLIESYKRMIEKVHGEGSRIIMQIAHAGCRAPTQFVKNIHNGPSSMDIEGYNCREMTISEISQIIEDFRNAALRAKKAGFDGVQIHAAHGYLISQFLSPFFNKRTDEYGGSVKNRTHFVLNIIRAIRLELGRQFTVIIKLNSDDFTDGGFTQSEMIQIATILETAGIDAIELSGSLSLQRSQFSSVRKGRIRSEEEEVYYRDAAKLYKKQINVPLILVGGIRSYKVAKELIEKEQADYVSLSRPLIREPQLIKRWESDHIEKAKCISCNKCLVMAKTGKGMYCIFENNNKAQNK